MAVPRLHVRSTSSAPDTCSVVAVDPDGTERPLPVIGFRIEGRWNQRITMAIEVEANALDLLGDLTEVEVSGP